MTIRLGWNSYRLSIPELFCVIDPWRSGRAKVYDFDNDAIWMIRQFGPLVIASRIGSIA